MFEPDDIAELFKGSVPYYILIILSLFIIISPVPITGSHEFPVYRMHQYDLHGVPHGSRSSSVNLEARTLNNWQSSRHCVVAKLEELTSNSINSIRSTAGGLIVVLPYKDDPISDEKREHIRDIETTMLSQEFSIPVYFIERTKTIESILNDITDSFSTKDKTASYIQGILSTVSANGYQLVMNPGQPIAKTDIQIATLQGKLSGNGVESKLPTIGIVAYYDSNSIAPELSFGADSNGSGVVILLELMRIFSQLYSNSKMHAKFNILFLLTGGGKLNYQGSKKWLEDQLDGLESSIIQESVLVMCLDTVASGNSLYMHVSKTPKEGSATAEFFRFLKATANQLRPHLAVEGVYKKVTYLEEFLSWEHERYSVRRLPGFTLSSFKSHRTIRGSIIDSKESLNLNLLEDKALVIAETLGRFVYNVSVGDVFPEHLGIERESLKASVDFIAGLPRANQVQSDKNSHLVNSLKDIMSRYLSDVKITYLKPDKRDPEFALYDITHAKLFVYSVKPAVFDLFLTFAIAIYLGLYYLAVQNFSHLYTFMCKFSQPTKTKKQ